MKWPIESIPDEDLLFYRIHKNNIVEGELIPGAFREIGSGESRSMSTNWDKYSTPQQAHSKASTPKDNGIVSFLTGNLRGIDLSITHAPDPERNDRSHTDVNGINVENRVNMMNLYMWEIRAPGL